MKLFALEDNEIGDEEIILDTAPEEGEVANVELELAPEATEVEEQSSAIDEGLDAADQLEEVQTVVADSVSSGEGEGAADGDGLDEVAAESIRIAIEAISARLDYNPKKISGMRAVYASEAFAAPSSRVANSKLALEGIGEMLADLWKKIKSAIKRLMEKAKAFWEKYFTGLGRAKMALEAMKARIKKAKGEIKDKSFIEKAPGALAAAFGYEKDISANVVKGVIAAHSKALKAGDQNVTEKLIKYLEGVKIEDGETVETINTQLGGIFGEVKSQEIGPLVGGVTIKVTVEDGEEGEKKVSFEKVEATDKKEEVSLTVPKKEELGSIVDEALTVINETIKAKKDMDKMSESFNKLMLNVDQKLSAVSADDTGAAKPARVVIKNVYKAFAVRQKSDSVFFGLNVKLAKAVLGYTGFCMKRYA